MRMSAHQRRGPSDSVFNVLNIEEEKKEGKELSDEVLNLESNWKGNLR